MDLEQRIAMVEQQLRASQDREAVWQLMARYAKAVDEEDDVALAAIGVKTSPVRRCPGQKVGYSKVGIRS